MHHIHRTQAFVLKSFPIKEADRSVILLTENLGVILAIAQGSRKMESKMRQSIQDFSLLNVALVSGRTGWRLINAGFIKNFYKNLSNEKLRESICKVFNLINRLVAGEMEDETIFRETFAFVNFAEKNEKEILQKEDVLSFEAIFLARILYHLGYLKLNDDINLYLKGEVNLELIQKLNEKGDISQKDLISEINRAISDSDL